MMNRAELQAALQLGDVQLEAGTYEISTPPSTSGQRRPYGVVKIGDRLLRGVGPETVLRFTGDASGADWYGLELTSGAVTDLTIDTSTLTGTSEQTHATQITGPGIGPEVARVTFNHPDRGLPGGDGIRILGYAATPVVGARIHHNDFALCDRSGVAIHSGTHDLQITDNVFRDVGDQDIDGEGSGDNFDWLIARNVFYSGKRPQGDYAIQLHNVERVETSNNRFFGRGIFVLNGNFVEIHHNSIYRTTSASGVGVIEIDKASSVIEIHNNSIVRAASSGFGYVVRCLQRQAGAPDHVTIRNNTLVQACAGDVVITHGVVGLHIEGNTVVYSGPANQAYGLSMQGTPTQRTDDIRINHNVWSGPLTGCVGVNGAYAGVGSVELDGNVALGPLKGLVCGNVAGIAGPITETANGWALAVGWPPRAITIPRGVP